RNPIYAADVAILIGWGVSLGAALPFLVVPAFAVVIQRRFILAEEARLEAAFGEAFRDYKTRVRRWI
ncbi:MAG: isoprenylcysteine carboxylmethyltransferase family protein, partial [Pseudomonadota bacterium]